MEIEKNIQIKMYCFAKGWKEMEKKNSNIVEKKNEWKTTPLNNSTALDFSYSFIRLVFTLKEERKRI